MTTSVACYARWEPKSCETINASAGSRPRARAPPHARLLDAREGRLECPPLGELLAVALPAADFFPMYLDFCQPSLHTRRPFAAHTRPLRWTRDSPRTVRRTWPPRSSR